MMLQPPPVKEECRRETQDTYSHVSTNATRGISHIEAHRTWDDKDDLDVRSQAYIGQCEAHAHDIYQPPRVTSVAERMHMVPGVELDTTTIVDNLSAIGHQ